MTETSYIIINSKYRTYGSRSSSDFTYSLGESLEVSNVAIKSVSMVNAEYNVKSGHNVLLVNIGGGDLTLTVPAGQYSINQLITELQTSLQSLIGGTVTIVLNATTNKIEITSTTPVRFNQNSITSPVAKLIGLSNQSITSPSNVYFPQVVQTSIFAPYLPNLNGANNYHILSSTLGQGKGSLLKNNDKRPIIVTIPANVDFGEVINFEVNEIHLNQRHFNRPINIQDIDIRVLDDDNEIVDLGGTDIEIVLQIMTTPVLPFSVGSNYTKF